MSLVVAFLLVFVNQYMGLNKLRYEKAKAQNVGLESQFSDGFVPRKLHFADEEQVPEQQPLTTEEQAPAQVEAPEENGVADNQDD